MTRSAAEGRSMQGDYYWELTLKYSDGTVYVHPHLLLSKANAENTAASYMNLNKNVVGASFKKKWRKS